MKETYTGDVYVFFDGKMRMKRLVGYTMFVLGGGMLLAIILPSDFLAILIALALLLIGYNLFCCKG